MIVVLYYGMGNLRSVERAIAWLGFESRVQTNLEGASKLILPGVGAFGAAMERLSPLASDIRAFAASGSPLLGICLGQQLLFETSEELGEHRGLGLLGGSVRYFRPTSDLKVPHMGWNALRFRDSEMGAGIDSEDQVYFVHSLVTVPDDPRDVAAETEYGETFASAVRRGNVWGTQFHPEKSGTVGLHILKNFLTC